MLSKTNIICNMLYSKQKKNLKIPMDLETKWTMLPTVWQKDILKIEKIVVQDITFKN